MFQINLSHRGIKMKCFFISIQDDAKNTRKHSQPHLFPCLVGVGVKVNSRQPVKMSDVKEMCTRLERKSALLFPLALSFPDFFFQLVDFLLMLWLTKDLQK